MKHDGWAFGAVNRCQTLNNYRETLCSPGLDKRGFGDRRFETGWGSMITTPLQLMACSAPVCVIMGIEKIAITRLYEPWSGNLAGVGAEQNFRQTERVLANVIPPSSDSWGSWRTDDVTSCFFHREVGCGVIRAGPSGPVVEGSGAPGRDLDVARDVKSL